MSSQPAAPDIPADVLERLMRRLWPAYCLLAALVTFGSALYDPYQIDGDAVSYMDLADLIRTHQWSGVINGYWNPLYPAILALGRSLSHATRFTELRAFYLVNFALFLLQMAAMVLFTDALLELRRRHAEAGGASLLAVFLFNRYPMRYLGIALVVLAAQREFSMGKIRPDALFQTLLLFAAAALLRHLATGRLCEAALLGLTLALAYLAKSVAVPLALFCLVLLAAARLFWFKHPPARVVLAVLLTLGCFTALAGPYIAALSLQKGRFDFGDSGSLNLAWFVSGTAKMHLQPSQPERFGAAQVHLRHPETELLKSPAVLSYTLLPWGTYPDWFDPSFWNDRIQPGIQPRLLGVNLRNSALRLLRYLTNHPEPCILLAVLFLLGARIRRGWRGPSNAFWIVPAALGSFLVLLYAGICIEDRYVSPGVTLTLLALFAALTCSAAQHLRATASSLTLLLSVLLLGQTAHTAGELRRNLAILHSPGGWYDPGLFEAAHALNQLGVQPGDPVACIGDLACLHDHHWARLAGVRILTEVYEPSLQLYPVLAAMPGRDRVYDLLRQQGAKVLVGSFDPGSMTGDNPVSAGWIRLGRSFYYALPMKQGRGERGEGAEKRTVHEGIRSPVPRGFLSPPPSPLSPAS